MIINPGVIQLQIPSESGYLELIRTFVVQLANRLGFDDDAADQIELAVDEACTNVVKYAYQQDGVENSLDVTLEAGKKKLTVIIRDHGIGFNPSCIETPEMRTYLSEYRSGGLGIYLMKTLMDEVSYDIEPGVKTEVKMTKYIPSILDSAEELSAAA